MKAERERIRNELQQAGKTNKPKDIAAEVDAIVDRIWSLDRELQDAKPERLRELFNGMVERIELRFRHVQCGKRLECPLESGIIHLRADSPMFGPVSGGDRI